MIFALSKILWAFAAPGSFLALLLALGLLLHLCPHARRLGLALSWFVCACLLALAILPVGEWALAPLEDRFAFAPPAHVDGIIVLGGDEQAAITEARGLPVALDSMRRYLEFVTLARRYPDAKLVFSGGMAHPRLAGHVQDADVARMALAAMGAPVDKMVFETRSRNTYENAQFSAAILHPQRGQNWLLVTSAWHMPRAMGCFRKAGFNVYAAPAGYFTLGRFRARFLFRFESQLRDLTLATHEYIGLAAYYLMGRINSPWPG